MANPSAWGLLLVLAAVGAHRRPRWAAALAGLAAMEIVAFSLPMVAGTLDRWVESSVPTTYRPDRHYDAAIVLGGGDDRVVGGARVVRNGRGAHLVYTGVLSPAGLGHVERLLRAQGLDDRQIVLGMRARNTYENAVEAADLAQRHGWRSLVIVTDARHMARALGCFQARGLEPDTLPVDAGGEPRGRGWLPSRAALDDSRAVLHEIVGRFVYRAVGYSA